MNYYEGLKAITHQHELADTFPAQYAAHAVEELNIGRPENFKPFHAEKCDACGQIHIRKGKSAFIKK